MTIFEKGSTIIVEVEMTDYSVPPSYINADAAVCSIMKPDKTLDITEASMTNDSLGHYHYDYNSSANAVSGVYESICKLTKTNRVVIKEAEFIIE